MKNQNPTYQRIRQYIEQLVEKNYHNPAYMLPSENYLANMFQTSRTPVQKVLAELREEGVIYKVQGKGTFIARADTPEETKIIYALFPHIRSQFMQDIVCGMNDYFRDKNVHLMIMLTDDDPQTEEKKLEYVMAHNGAGILFYPIITPTYHDVLIKLLLKNCEVVVVANHLAKLKFSSVHCDYYEQAYRVTERLMDLGHANIAFISEWGKDNSVYRERVQGHWDCLLHRNSRSIIRLLELDTASAEDMRGAPERIREFLDKNADATAIITMSCVADEVYRQLREERQDEDTVIAVIDEPTDSNILRKKNVLVLDQMPYQIGWKAAEQLYRQVVSGEAPREIITTDRFVLGTEWERCKTPTPETNE